MTDKQKVQLIVRSESLRFVGTLSLGSAVGLFFGHTYTGLVLAVVVLLARYMFISIGLMLWIFLGREPGVSSNHVIYSVIDRIQAIINQQQLRKKQATNLARGFRDLLRALPDAIVLINKEYKIEWLSDRAIQFLPLEKSDVGNVITALIRKPDFSSFIQNVGYQNTLVLRIETDSPRYLRVHKIVYNEQSDLLVFRDITRIYHMQQRQTSFIAHASHELNTPLTVIRGYSELAYKHMQDDKGKKILQKVMDETDRMASLTGNLLTLASLDQSSSNTTGQWFDPVAIIESSSQQLKETHRYKDRKITIKAEKNLLLRAREEDISTVFSNLIDNALKYSDSDVSLSWQLANDGSGVFAVTDKGEGISEPHMKRVSERFYRIPQSQNKKDPGGTGLGLSIVQSVLNRYQADLLIESEPGKGCRFSCLFPKSMVKSTG